MKIMVMKKSGRRLAMTERRAALFTKMGIAHEDSAVVVKSGAPGPAEEERASMEEPDSPEGRAEESPADGEVGGKIKNKPKPRRQYKRRDLRAEEEPACRKEWKRYSSSSD